MKIITGNKGEEILVDDDDYDFLNRHNWNVNMDGYVTASLGNVTVKMHRLVMFCPKGLVVDHVNRNKLDNRKENLRHVTVRQNSMNVGKTKHNISGYIGVKFHKCNQTYVATVSENKKHIYLVSMKGKENTELLAKFRDYAAILLRGEYAALNFPTFDYENWEHPKLEQVKMKIEKFKQKKYK